MTESGLREFAEQSDRWPEGAHRIRVIGSGRSPSGRSPMAVQQPAEPGVSHDLAVLGTPSGAGGEHTIAGALMRALEAVMGDEFVPHGPRASRKVGGGDYSAGRSAGPLPRSALHTASTNSCDSSALGA